MNVGRICVLSWLLLLHLHLPPGRRLRCPVRFLLLLLSPLSNPQHLVFSDFRRSVGRPQWRRAPLLPPHHPLDLPPTLLPLLGLLSAPFFPVRPSRDSGRVIRTGTTVQPLRRATHATTSSTRNALAGSGSTETIGRSTARSPAALLFAPLSKAATQRAALPCSIGRLATGPHQRPAPRGSQRKVKLPTATTYTATPRPPPPPPTKRSLTPSFASADSPLSNLVLPQLNPPPVPARSPCRHR